MKRLRVALVLAIAIGATGCGLQNLLGDSPSSPSDTTAVRSYLGTWLAPTATSFPTAQSCGSLQWKITSQTGSQFGGDFQAACSGGTTLAGTLVATHSPTTIPWAASGTATQGGNSCPFNMTGTGTFQGTSNILVNYAGASCFGQMNGTDTITR